MPKTTKNPLDSEIRDQNIFRIETKRYTAHMYTLITFTYVTIVTLTAVYCSLAIRSCLLLALRCFAQHSLEKKLDGGAPFLGLFGMYTCIGGGSPTWTAAAKRSERRVYFYCSDC